MEFSEAIKYIERNYDYEQFSEVVEVFEGRLEELKQDDHTEKATCYYYLIRVLMMSHMVHETEEVRELYDKMNDSFKTQEDIYHDDPDRKTDQEIADFYHLVEKAYSSLENLYERKHFKEAQYRAYKRKMHFRMHSHKLYGRTWQWLEYKFYDLTSNFGISFLRWGITALVFGLFSAMAYFLTDIPLEMSERIVGEGGHWFDYIYFSIVTLTSLGFGDLVPYSLMAKIGVTLEAVFGFIMLGIFINLIQKRL